MGVAKPARLLAAVKRPCHASLKPSGAAAKLFELEMPFSPHTLSLRPCATSHNEVKLVGRPPR